MTANLYPLIYSPGIQRDGTQFQSEYCLDGQWIRFQRGKVKKIGGMKGASTIYGAERVTNLAIFPWERGGILIFLCSEQGLAAQINSPDWAFAANNNLLNAAFPPTVLWETATVIDTGSNKAFIVFMKTNNALDITQNSASEFFRKEINQALNGAVEQNVLRGVNPLINGGLCFAAPYLFIYGSNGLVQYSTSNDPFDFRDDIMVEVDGPNGTRVQELSPNRGGDFTISNDKVIYGRPIRGGSNSPSLLFWTLSSVVRVANASIGDGEADFKSDTISTSSSILSSKCVVEYDGLFFWPGTDRFFVYNGIVQEMDNRMNLNYFYDNIDMERRQQVFGVKNTKYGEIWWFYPVKGVAGPNSRAIVYNKRENFWYDTAISRTAGVFSPDFGFMSTYGKFLVNDLGENNLWRHEVGVIENGFSGGAENPTPIPSSFTTPIFSWVAFPPKPNRGSMPSQFINRWVDLQRIEPDFVTTAGVPDRFEVLVNTQEYAQSPVVTSAPVPFTGNSAKLDMRVQGRNMSLTFRSIDNFEVGHIILLLGMGDAR